MKSYMEYKNVLVDSSVWYAFFSEDDSNHEKALIFKDLYFQEQIMPDIVFYETVTVLKRKAARQALDQFIFYATEAMQITIRLFYEYNSEVLKLFHSESAQGLSYVDSLLLYLSKEYHILTFDEELKKLINQFGGKYVK